jgi:uncharacterized protein YciI
MTFDHYPAWNGSVKYVMFYETDPEKLPLARTHFAAHRARMAEFQSRGTLLMAGPLTGPAGGALGIFTSREAAEEFIRDDPFVLHGVVKTSTVREWNEVLAP